jgi:hypothetical protein
MSLGVLVFTVNFPHIHQSREKFESLKKALQFGDLRNSVIQWLTQHDEILDMKWIEHIEQLDFLDELIPEGHPNRRLLRDCVQRSLEFYHQIIDHALFEPRASYATSLLTNFFLWKDNDSLDKFRRLITLPRFDMETFPHVFRAQENPIIVSDMFYINKDSVYKEIIEENKSRFTPKIINAIFLKFVSKNEKQLVKFMLENFDINIDEEKKFVYHEQISAFSLPPTVECLSFSEKESQSRVFFLS